MTEKNENMKMPKALTPEETIVYYEISNAMLTALSKDALEQNNKLRKRNKLLIIAFGAYICYEKKVIIRIKKFLKKIDEDVKNS